MILLVCIQLNVLCTAVNIKQPRTRPTVSFIALTWFILRVNKVNHCVALCLQPISALRENTTDNTANSLLLCTKTQSQLSGVKFSVFSKQKMKGEYNMYPEEIKDMLHILFPY